MYEVGPNIDQYNTLVSPSEGEYKEKGSKFISFALAFDHEDALEYILQGIKSQHPKARHFCYAYKIGLDDDRYRVNDDGEPSGTAGKPILGQILSHQLTHTIIVVVRYFGGTKLGASGLIHAYKEASRDALSKATIVEKYLYSHYELIFEYAHMGQILSVIKSLEVDITDKSFDIDCRVSFQVRLSQEHHLLLSVKAALMHRDIEDVDIDTEIPICKLIKVA
ncbi:MAG: YigZ family protein [Saprospiraceae bacterium]